MQMNFGQEIFGNTIIFRE